MSAPPLWRRYMRAARWSPLDLGADLILYWDQYYRTTTAGGAISSWQDKRFVADAVQATGGNQPADTGGYIVFDGVSDEVTCTVLPAGLPANAVAGWQWFLVDQRVLASDTADKVLGGYGGSTTASARRLFRRSLLGVNRAAFSCGSQLVVNDAVEFSGPRTAVCKYSGTAGQMDVDGIAGTPITTTPSTGVTRLRMGASTVAAASAWANCGFKAHLITRPLSVDNEVRLLAWAAARLAA